MVILKSIGKKYPVMKKLHKGVNLEDFWALKDINLDIGTGQTIGVIGRNGAGKTTLLNVIAGVLSPSKGDLLVNGKVMGLFNLGVGFQDELSGRENIFLNGAILGADRRKIEQRLDAIIEFSELGNFINMPLGSYSQGMRLRLGFSIIANLDFDILVIDEVLAVGDALFQNKCFERLVEFKRLGKTLIITTQGMDLIERLCNKVILLDHGSLLFSGEVLEGINRYRNLLNTEKFFVGLPQQKRQDLVENTKKWADNISDWGNKFGGKEIVIDSVEFINKFGYKANRINTLDNLKIKVFFTVRYKVENPHFGIAIFRNDGVYCYGPNTEFDRLVIPELKQGKGYFMLDYYSLLLAPGGYRVSIAIWDKNETLAFDHHYGYYELIVTGPDNKRKELLSMPFRINCPSIGHRLAYFFASRKNNPDINLDLLADKFGQISNDDNIKIECIKILDHNGNSKDFFMTNENISFVISLNYTKPFSKDLYLWLGIYRDDGVYCQGVTTLLCNRKNYNIFFPKFSLLPGLYNISVGIWDSAGNKFLMYHHGVYTLKIVFNRQDHGTIFLEHKWLWKVV
ncbi:MAG: hypothetical protein A2047_00405 [Omnitrophica bacterium GWA2_41_15]|nr:MAG: hypothetical protein A2047_00405 [Omnitrophica bacterium GWA2_41_15]